MPPFLYPCFGMLYENKGNSVSLIEQNLWFKIISIVKTRSAINKGVLMLSGRKVFIILCSLLLVFLVSCTDNKQKDAQTSASTPAVTSATSEATESLLASDDDDTSMVEPADEATPKPATTVTETPAPPEEMERPVIPDEDNVSMPDPG